MPNQDKYLRRNMALGITNGVCFTWALAFLSGTTVIPLFISGMTDSRVIIGLFATMEPLGWYIPQFFTGIYIANQALVLPHYNKLSIYRILSLGLGVLSIFLISNNNPKLLLLAFGLSFAAYALISGVAGISFMEMVGKMIPLNKRGSFFGSRMIFGALLAALSGPILKVVLEAWEYPINFGYLYCFSFASITVGLILFAFVKEPVNKREIHSVSLKDNIKSSLTLLKTDPNIRRLILTKYLANAFWLSSPFYIITAIDKLGIPRATASTYLSFEMAGYLVANILWARISNKVSNKLVLRIASLCAIIPPALAILSINHNPGYLLFGLVFIFNGAATGGLDMGFTTYLLEIIDNRRRPVIVGLVHTLIAPTVFMAALGGFISEILDFQILFVITIIFLIAAFIIISRLVEPKRN